MSDLKLKRKVKKEWKPYSGGCKHTKQETGYGYSTNNSFRCMGTYMNCPSCGSFRLFLDYQMSTIEEISDYERSLFGDRKWCKKYQL